MNTWHTNKNGVPAIIINGWEAEICNGVAYCRPEGHICGTGVAITQEEITFEPEGSTEGTSIPFAIVAACVEKVRQIAAERQ